MASKLEIVRKIHSSGYQAVFAVTGGGSGAISDLLTVPGGSRFLLDAAVPYSFAAVTDLLRVQPDQFCSSQTAVDLALWAYRRGLFLAEKEKGSELSLPKDYRRILGVGVTASLVSDRPKKGAHRVHLAIQTFDRVFRFSLELDKGKRSRLQEERRAGELVLRILHRFITENPVSEDSSSFFQEESRTDSESLFFNMNRKDSLHYDLLSEKAESWDLPDWEPNLPGDKEDSESIKTALPLAKLLFCSSREDDSPQALRYGQGKWVTVSQKDLSEKSVSEPVSNPALLSALFPGSFNPIHRGHLKMIQLAEAHLGVPVDLEMAVVNADKPPIDFFSLQRRLAEIEKRLPDHYVWLTRFPLFAQKSAFFGPVTFLMGMDTLTRLIHPRYYQDSLAVRDEILRTFTARRERFLIFARPDGGKVAAISDLEIPSFFRSACEEVPPAVFTDDISSTILRKNGSFLF